MKNKIQNIIALFSFLIAFSSFAQQIKKESIDSGGGVFSSTNITVIQTIGELAIAEKNNGGISISEGFISPEILNTAGIDSYGILYDIHAYPNPTQDWITIKLKKTGNYSVLIYNSNGKLVKTKTDIHTDNTTLNLQNLQNASYLIVIKDIDNQLFKTFKVIKK